MRVVREKDLIRKNLKAHEQLFVDCWHGLTHMRSIDSHRVRCMNSRTIVRELNEEIRIARLDDPEMAGLCAETAQVLKADSVILTTFPQACQILMPLLERPPSLKKNKEKEKEDAENATRLRELTFAISDLSAALEARYLEMLCGELSVATSSQSNDDVPALTNSLLSDLVACGWPLESLHTWTMHFLKPGDQYTFQQNLTFMLGQMSRLPQQFKVTLRVSGGTKLQSIGDFGGFHCMTSSGISPKSRAEQKFANSGQYVVFASGIFPGVDFASAAIGARAEFESLLDILRFEYERTSLKIDHYSFVERLEDHETEMVEIDNLVPNPVEPLKDQDFRTFCERLDKAQKSNHIDSETKSRISAALRQYRFGRDSESYSDKFLNWWMGLETLANVGMEKIGRTVTRNVSGAMMPSYLFGLLRDLLPTLQYLNLPFEPEFEATAGVSSFGATNVSGLVRVLQDQHCISKLLSSLAHRPFVASKVKQIGELLSNPHKAAEQLESHRQRLQWHLDRLYRIRCCIVHGVPVRFKLALFAANMESYLKQTLIFCLNSLHDHTHIADLPSLFQRNNLVWLRRIESLKKSGASIDAINDAVFADVAVQK